MMRAVNLITILVASIMFSAIITGINAEAQMSISGQQDISQLMAAARQQYDLKSKDAVILFDGERRQWSADGRLTTYVHRIIWINSDVAINHYGDHRVPYDDANCNFKVVTVRTWRDSTWWETGETGIVETLPYAVDEARDYTNMREMMLLHNGIELPCILELAYTIEDKKPFRGGAEGLWLFEKTDPCVMSWFGMTLPEGVIPNAAATDNARYENATDLKTGMTTHWWKMGPLPARKQPSTADPASYTPHITWSTWKDWSELGNFINGAFEQAMTLDSTLKTKVDSIIENARTAGEKAERLVGFVDQATRLIRYPDHYWLSSPRPATVTYNTAYAHPLDRTVLAGALFAEAGLTTRAILFNNGYGNINEDIPSLARFGDFQVWVSGEDFEACYDPAEGSLTRGLTQIYGHTVWSPGYEDAPTVRLEGDKEANDLYIRIDLDLDAEKDTLSGRGFIVGNNAVNPFDRMSGLDNQAKSFLNMIISGIIEGAEITNYNLSRFDLFNVTAGFDFELPKIEPDDNDRLPLVIDDPRFGIGSLLPGNVELFDLNRTSPVHLKCLLDQKIELHLNLKGCEPDYLPESKELANVAGLLQLNTNKEEDKIIYSRRLKLSGTYYDSSLWPDFRELMLANNHERNRTFYFKKSAD